ncbi:hypothetical protein DMC30DRAFT_433369, partial [Rhodotorula diobovata]
MAIDDVTPHAAPLASSSSSSSSSAPPPPTTSNSASASTPRVRPPTRTSRRTPRPPLYHPDATIVLIGMRGVGKTTLGLIAATSLRRSFIDADSAFQTLHGPISAFVTARGWSAFRDAETAILRKLLDEHPRGYVIACGGGVVERDENCDLLRAFRDQGCPIVHVVRDKEETVRYLVDEQARPAWGEEIRHVWARRTPLFESLCTHTIASLTASPRPSSPQFLMKHVETAFVRLLRSLFGFASSHVPLVAGPRPPPVSGPSSGEYGGYGACESDLGRGAKGARTSFVALNFPDLRAVEAETIRTVAGGVDVIEMRVDTLVELEATPPPYAASSSRGASPRSSGSATPTPTPAPAPRRRRVPSPHFVALCFGHLRRCSPLPILYTVRTEPQGGAFPDPYGGEEEDEAGDPSARLDEYVALVELGFKLGAEYVDVELALPDRVIERLLALRGAATQVVGADHDRRGEWEWQSDAVLDKYRRAARLGCDVIKLVSTPRTFESNLELLKFRAKVDALPSPLSDSADAADAAAAAAADHPPRIPLLAINLGKGGQLSRYLNPVLTPVTHPLLPGVAAPGQLTYAQTQQALFLSGLILEKTFAVPSPAVAEAFAREAQTLGLPYAFVVVEDRAAALRTSTTAGSDDPTFGGAYLGSPALPLAVSSLPASDEVLPPALATGFADLSVPICDSPASYDVPPRPLAPARNKHTNVRVLALAEVLTQNLSPINAVGTHTCALLVGLARRDRNEVVEALGTVGARWVFLVACEEDDGPAEEEEHRMALDAPPASSSSALFASPTGGAALDLSWAAGAGAGGGGRRGLLSAAIESKRLRAAAASAHHHHAHHPKGGAGGGAGAGARATFVADGWQVLGARDVEAECDRQAFRALTGRRMG